MNHDDDDTAEKNSDGASTAFASDPSLIDWLTEDHSAVASACNLNVEDNLQTVLDANARAQD